MSEQRSPIVGFLTVVAGALTAVLRVIPHPANFTSIGAMGLFGGAKLRTWHAFALPIVVMLVSDFALYLLTWFDEKYSPLHISRLYVYASLLIYVAIGRAMLRKHDSLGWIVGASLLGSIQFFVVTNFFDWLLQPLQSSAVLPDAFRYSRDLSGLLACFVSALPFFQTDFPWSLHAFVMQGHPSYGVLGTILGDLVFTCGLFGLHGVLTQPKTETADVLTASEA